jgi:hypothetical protein
LRVIFRSGATGAAGDAAEEVEESDFRSSEDLSAAIETPLLLLSSDIASLQPFLFSLSFDLSLSLSICGWKGEWIPCHRSSRLVHTVQLERPKRTEFNVINYLGQIKIVFLVGCFFIYFSDRIFENWFYL